MNRYKLLFWPLLVMPCLAVTPALLERLEWRNIGPAVMGGRVADIAGEGTTLYVASASGGLFRSENSGITFTPIFRAASWTRSP